MRTKTNTKTTKTTKTSPTETQLHQQAWDWFIDNGYAPKDHSGWVLHHKDMTLKVKDPVRYAQWRVQDLVPLTLQAHRSLHMRIEAKGRKQSKAVRRKISKGKRSPIAKGKVIVVTKTITQTYKTISEAARAIGCSRQLISQCLRPNRTNRTALGYSIEAVES